MAKSSKKSDSKFIKYTQWVFGVRGVLLLIFGIVAVFWPGITLLSLLYVTAAFIIASGIITFFEAAASSGKSSGWFLRLLVGIAEVVFGIIIVRHPLVSLETFIILLGLYLLFRGIIELFLAFSDYAQTTSRGLLALGSILSIIAGLLIMFQPDTGGLAFVWVIGLYAILAGVISIVTAFQLRKA
jgi:uncharacterized membrane protein HdeD (DUF308 family)